MSGSAVALDALADVDMLADTDMFAMPALIVLVQESAYAHAMGRKGRPPPIISLEAPWSPFKGAEDGQDEDENGWRWQREGRREEAAAQPQGAREFSAIESRKGGNTPVDSTLT